MTAATHRKGCHGDKGVQACRVRSVSGTQLELVRGGSREADNSQHRPSVERASSEGSELTIPRGVQAESDQPSTGKIVKSTNGYRVGLGTR